MRGIELLGPAMEKGEEKDSLAMVGETARRPLKLPGAPDLAWARGASPLLRHVHGTTFCSAGYLVGVSA